MTVENPSDDLNELWRRARAVLRHQLGERMFKDGIDTIRPVSMDDARIVLACATAEGRDRVFTRYGACVANVLAYLSKTERQVDFIFDPETRLAVDNADGDANVPDPLLVEGSGRLDRKMTFRTFVKGASNAAAHGAAQGVADAGEARANPLFLFGPAGFGKTHLLQAIVWRICERDAGKRVLFLTSPKAYGAAAVKDVADKIDVLICDDLQASKDQANIDAFHHLIDELLAQGKQVVLAADVPASSIEHLPAQLRARLAADGVEIRPGDYELRLAIVRAMAARRAREAPAFAVGDNVLRMIAARIKKDARILGGALTRLETCSDGGKTPITFAAAQGWLDDFLREQRKTLTVGAIKQMVAMRHNVDVKDIDSNSRRREVVFPRQLAMYLTRRLTERSYPELGRSFKRDHSTVLHGYERIRQRCSIDPAFAEYVEALVRSLLD